MEMKNLNTTQKAMLIIGTIVMVGIVFATAPLKKEATEPTFGDEAASVVSDKVSMDELSYEESLEKKLSEILAALEGAGETKVMVTTRTTDEQVLAQEVIQIVEKKDETDVSGKTRTDSKEDTKTKVVMKNGSTPFIVKKNRPQIEGVLVLAEGADNVTVRNAIIQAVASVLNVPVHKIAVFKMA